MNFETILIIFNPLRNQIDLYEIQTFGVVPAMLYSYLYDNSSNR